MADVRIQMIPNGPFLVDSSIEVVDSEGNAFPLDSSKPKVALCRCGHSKEQPFCDGSHKGAGFTSDERSPV